MPPDGCVAAIADARRRKILGRRPGSGRGFERDAVGAGAYICGRGNLAAESLEGKRGMVAFQAAARRSGPVRQAHRSSTTCSSRRCRSSTRAAFYATTAMGRSRGTMPLQLAGNIRHGGPLRRPFGLTLARAGLTISAAAPRRAPVRAVQVGGPRRLLPPAASTPLDYDEEARRPTAAGSWRHRGVRRHRRHGGRASRLEFCAIESCGKCTPCRIGSTRGVEVIDRIMLKGEDADKNRFARRSLPRP